MPKPPPPCGTRPAYYRHLHYGESPCDACREAAGRQRRPAPAPRELEPCGTPAAARRHWRHHEPLDDACRRASRYSNNSAEPGTRAEDWRPIRNGVPEPVRYVYGLPRPSWALAALGRAAAIYGWPDDLDEEEAS